ncbi:MAG: DNA polymerase III subunit delta [Gemmatimonadota bacterium]|nr:DNA polymerase III subunit delta [Gemmatimonadota bacterium]
MSSAQRTLRDAVRDKQFAAVYYLFGEDDFLKEQAVRQLVGAAVDPATRDFNLEVRRGGELDAETLGSLLGTPPMMAERRVLVVRDVGALRKDARTLLDRYVKSPAPDAVVILVAPAGARADRTLSAAATALEFEPLTGDRVPRWITYHAETELGASITPEAVALLQSAVGTDLPQLAVELDKLASFAGGGAIDEAAVAAIVGVRRGETLGAFLDAVAARDLVAALDLLPGVLAQPKASAVTIVMALTAQTLAIAWARARRERGLAPGRLAGELFGLLKEAGSVYPGRAWGEAVDAWARAAARPDEDDPDGSVLDAALSALLAADFALKETRLSSDEQLLTNLVLTLCTARGSRGGGASARGSSGRRGTRAATAEHA